MTNTPLSSEFYHIDAWRVEYLRLRKLRELLLEEMSDEIRRSLADAKIEVLNIENRVKSFDSLIEKGLSKGWPNPLQSAEDICGIRIIGYTLSDLDAIIAQLRNVHFVTRVEDTVSKLLPNQFGYSSRHVIIQAPLGDGTPQWVEIQVRTILMHAWANMSHRFLYKHDTDAPIELQRQFGKLSALLEVCDDHLLSIVSTAPQSGIASAPIAELPSEARELRADSLRILLDTELPAFDRLDDESLPSLLYNLRSDGLTLGDLSAAIAYSKPEIKQIESEVFTLFPESRGWRQDGAVSIILLLAFDDLWKKYLPYEYPPEIPILERWRARLKETHGFIAPR